MSLFRRRKGDAPTSTESEPNSEAEDRVERGPGADGEQAEREEVLIDRSDGPFDESEFSDLSGHLDLGALKVKGIDGMQLQLEVDEQQQVIGATATIADSHLQLQAFAAPRSGGLWREIRDEIAQSIATQGGTADEVDGDLGTELHARIPSEGPDGRTVFAPARFVGVDGPRWFLRGVISGRGAIDAEAARPLLEVYRATVVVRGSGPRAPRELLALSLPEADRPAPGTDEDAQAPPRDLDPFERGPEITEVR